MSGVGVVTDSASDLTDADAQTSGITVVPLFVVFGDTSYRAGVEMSAEHFWREVTKPGAPFPKTAAAAPGTFRAAFEAQFENGADEVVYVGVGNKLSATLGSARLGREMLPDRPISIVDSESASMVTGLLAKMAAEMAAAGAGAAEIVAHLERRRASMAPIVALETLDYLRRGGRISSARASIGSLLSVKPIITVRHGEVEAIDQPRTRSRARGRLLELISAQPLDAAVVLHSGAADIDQFAADLIQATGLDGKDVPIVLIGPSVGVHVGPGAYGAAVVRRD